MILKAKSGGFSPEKQIKNTIWHTIKIIMYFLMIIWSISFVAIFVWMVINSLKTGMDYTKDVFSLPEKWDWSNYKEVFTGIQFKGYSLLGMFGNTLIFILINVLCVMTFPQMAAYTIARFDFTGKKLLESIIYASMIVPIIGTLGPTLNFMFKTKMYDTWFGMFFMCSSAFGFLQMVLTSFYKGLESAYAEAAYMDGASEWVVFTKIYYPQSLPVLLPTLITTVIGALNNFMDIYLFLPSHPTVALGLQQMQKTYVTFGNDYPLLFAGLVVMLIPILIIFACFSNTMLNNKNLGALK